MTVWVVHECDWSGRRVVAVCSTRELARFKANAIDREAGHPNSEIEEWTVLASPLPPVDL